MHNAILPGSPPRLAGGSPREARSLVHQHLPDAQLPVFLRTLRADVEALFESRKATQK